MCGKEFAVRNYRKDTARFCSRNCLNQWLGKKHTGTTRSKETIEKVKQKITGKKRTYEQCLRIGNAKIGKEPWNKGKKGVQIGPNHGKNFSQEWKNKLSTYRKGVYCKEKHPLWKGGISFEPYCPKFDEQFKERVRAFFNHTCVLCGEKQNGYKLPVHHVEYDKYVCCNGNPPLFVLLCKSCHAKTNFNREYWAMFFNEFIHIQYGGKCYYTKEEYQLL